MNLLFCYDGKLSMDKDGNAYPLDLTQEVLARYFNIADQLTLLLRTKIVDTKKSDIPKLDQENIRIVSCPNLSSLSGIFFKRKEAARLIERELKNSDYMISRLPSFIGNLGIDIARKLGKPYLVEVVGCPWDAYWNHGIRGKIVAPYIEYATRKRVGQAQYTLYVTNEFLQKRYPNNAKNINCSDVALIDFNSEILDKRLNRISQNNKKIVIGTIAGVNVRFKGQQYVIRALAKLKNQGIDNYEYHLVGGGEQDYLKSVASKSGVSDQVKFLGKVSHNKIFEWLDQIDIYIQPSRQEGLPRALVEAMSRGLPAIGAKTGGIPELLEESYIFSNTRRNIDKICNILQNLTTEKMREQAIRNFEESKNYDKNILDERRNNFYNDFKQSCKSEGCVIFEY